MVDFALILFFRLASIPFCCYFIPVLHVAKSIFTFLSLFVKFFSLSYLFFILFYKT